MMRVTQKIQKHLLQINNLEKLTCGKSEMLKWKLDHLKK